MLTFETQGGASIEVGTRRVTPQARVLQLRTRWGGAVWCLPSAVIVEEPGDTRRIPIVPLALLLELGLMGLLIAAMIWSVRGTRVKKTEAKR